MTNRRTMSLDVSDQQVVEKYRTMVSYLTLARRSAYILGLYAVFKLGVGFSQLRIRLFTTDWGQDPILFLLTGVSGTLAILLGTQYLRMISLGRMQTHSLQEIIPTSEVASLDGQIILATIRSGRMKILMVANAFLGIALVLVSGSIFITWLFTA